MKSIKTIFRIILATVLVFTAGITSAASLSSPSGLDVLVTKVHGGSYSHNININDGDTLHFNVHAYANGGDVNNVKLYLGNLTGTEINGNRTISGYVDGDSVSRLNDSVVLHSSERVKLVFDHSTLQLNECQSESCAVLRNYKAYYTATTLYKDERLNGVFTYKVEKVSNPINGSCGSSINTCSAGTFSDRSDTSTQYRWTCNGVDGGSDTTCSIDKEVEEDEVTVSTNTASNIDTNSAKLNGRITEGDNATVWFVYSRTDSTPECNGNDTQVNVSGRYDDGDYFSKTISGLRDNTTYYYRACASISGDTDDGVVRSFTTDEEEEEVEEDEVTVSTNTASNIDTNSAKLNGRITEGDNATVWFVYSRTDSTPECNGNDTQVNVSGRYDDGDYFSKTISGLRDNTTYYYRACASISGDTDDGVVRSFTTDEETVNHTNLKPLVYTNHVEYVKINEAKVWARVNMRDYDNAEVYFLYWKTLSNVQKTNDYSVSATQNFWGKLTGLNPGTRYYYQAIVKDNDDNILDKGVVKSFVTTSTTHYVPPVVYVPPTTGTVTVKISDVVEVKPDLEVTKFVSNVRTGDWRTEIDANKGDTVYYKIVVRNNTDEVMKNIKVTDFIPDDITLENNADAKKATFFVDELQPGEETITIDVIKVQDDATVEISDAEFTYDGDSQRTNKVTINADKDNGQGAFIFGSNSNFFPSTLTGYLLLIALILAIAYFAFALWTKRPAMALNRLKDEE